MVLDGASDEAALDGRREAFDLRSDDCARWIRGSGGASPHIERETKAVRPDAYCHDAHRCPRCRSDHTAPQECRTMQARHPGCRRAQRSAAGAKYLGRALWRRWSGDHRRRRAETKMHCVKLLGQRLSARDFDRQVSKFQVRVAVLNGFRALGTPITEVAGWVCPTKGEIPPSVDSCNRAPEGRRPGSRAFHIAGG